ncbi:hypothetical protein IFM89_008101 [Coptis chinensis]|uniref:UDP-glycosyltransferase n=1 Tax=Coptis chinensis TaxID=261450 RepID=A0A835IZ16_9MAGN|nr:hypothetical protein IFM89_008101 [Coptis chinensis]
MGRPHLLFVPYPAQGHVMPIMELAHNLVDLGFKITVANPESTHNRLVASTSNNVDEEDHIHMVAIPDGIETGKDIHEDVEKLYDAMEILMPRHLEDQIRKINESNNSDDRITCIITDEHMGWVFVVAKKMSIRGVAFWPASAVQLALKLRIPKLIEDGIITSEDGTVTKHQLIHLSPTVPAMSTAHFMWQCMATSAFQQKTIFELLVRNNRRINLADYLICNSFYELEPTTFSLVPNMKPLGPFFGSGRLAQFWPEDLTCLSWLDQQPPRSVIYVAFGSLTVFDKRQIEELALGLELSGQPFLWVVRPDLIDGGTDVFPDGFEARVASRGRMICWAPQREVLVHPSIACFLSHCGWNSIMEGLSVGVPFLCWPFFYDQPLNKAYICDVWKIGIGFNQDESGIISREEIQTKIVALLANAEIKGNALKLKEIAMKNVSREGASSKNFEEFVQWLKI